MHFRIRKPEYRFSTIIISVLHNSPVNSQNSSWMNNTELTQLYCVVYRKNVNILNMAQQPRTPSLTLQLQRGAEPFDVKHCQCWNKFSLQRLISIQNWTCKTFPIFVKAINKQITLGKLHPGAHFHDISGQSNWPKSCFFKFSAATFYFQCHITADCCYYYDHNNVHRLDTELDKGPSFLTTNHYYYFHILSESTTIPDEFHENKKYTTYDSWRLLWQV